MTNLEAKPAQATWTLRVLGGFELTAPDGKVVKLPTRKADALLSILAIRGAEGIGRKELGRTLWPGSARESRQTNLRQCLVMLRKVLGPEAVTATREKCQLSVDFPLVCEDCQEELSQSERSYFMPGYAEPLFEEIRRSPGQVIQLFERPLSKGPMEGFEQLLTWCAENDPIRATDLLRTNRDLVAGITPNSLKKILESAERKIKPDAPEFGWLTFWKGVQVLAGTDLDSAGELLYRALSLGKEHGDTTLMIESGCFLGCVGIVIGRIDFAEKVLERILALGDKVGDPLVKARIDCFVGNLRAHQDRSGEGLQALESASRKLEGHLFEFVQNEALRAMYHATRGEFDEADRLLAYPEQVASDTGHYRLDCIARFVRGLVTMGVGEPSSARRILESAAEKAAAGGAGHITIYARESLAVLELHERNRYGVTEHMRATGTMRRSLKMAYTPWDKHRLSELRTG